MPLPNEPVTISAEQIREFHQKLADLRHDVNNCLSLMTAAVELIRRRPENAESMWDTLIEQPQKIIATISQFSRDFEAVLHITKP
jgi:hypothetical protein